MCIFVQANAVYHDDTLGQNIEVVPVKVLFMDSRAVSRQLNLPFILSNTRAS